MDVYFKGWISKNFKEAFKMDFVRPPYKTILDAEIEEAEEKGEEKAHCENQDVPSEHRRDLF